MNGFLLIVSIILCLIFIGPRFVYWTFAFLSLLIPLHFAWIDSGVVMVGLFIAFGWFMAALNDIWLRNDRENKNYKTEYDKFWKNAKLAQKEFRDKYDK